VAVERQVQIVVDTSVLVAAIRSRRGASFKLLEEIKNGRWKWNISAALAFEYEAAGKREASRLGLPSAAIDDIIDMICQQSRHHPIHYRLRPTLPDRDDEFILELAFAANCEYIVTHNVRDFRGSISFGALVVTPGEFLRRMEVGL
jgi:putative PIN family toxin of toxin-antitoxin system